MKDAKPQVVRERLESWSTLVGDEQIRGKST